MHIMCLVIILNYYFKNRTISVETFDSINPMDMKDVLIVVKVARYGIIFVNIHGVCIRIV